MSTEGERRLILEMIESGKITAEDGLHLLEALATEDEPAAGLEPGSAGLFPAPEPGKGAEGEPAGSGADQAEEGGPAGEAQANSTSWVGQKAGERNDSFRPPRPPNIDTWRRWWMLPLWVGVGITVFGALVLAWVQLAAGIGLWFICASLPLLLGVALIVLAWRSRTAHWIHIRVDQRPGEWPQRIALSFPIPLRFAAWFLRTFRHKIPGLQETSLDETILALGESATPDNPIYIEVNEGEDGERVQVFIG